MTTIMETSMPQTTTATATKVSAKRPGPYKLARVEKTGAPEGGTGGNWYRYVLDNGRSTVVGQRCGSLKDVTAYANRCAEQLNSRTLSGQSVWAPRSSKKPAATTS
jgi:hypothetical protein